MQHFWSLYDVTLQETFLTIGTFDGVHVGHQRILEHLVQGATERGLNSVVVTFFPHPAVVLGKRSNFGYLTSPEERARLMGEIGVDYVITQTFSKKTGDLPAKEFIEQLKNQLGFVHLVVGHDFALGRKREGDVERLKELGSQLHFDLEILRPERLNGKLVSSSLIREVIAHGDVEKAADLLGHPFEITGKIIHGDGRGKTIGIPTANLQTWQEQAVPKNGVYACTGSVGGIKRYCLVNIGTRPTFHTGEKTNTIEAYLLDFDGNIYGEEMRLSFVSRLRDEIRFSGIESLISQIHKDIEHAKNLFAFKGV